MLMENGEHSNQDSNDSTVNRSLMQELQSKLGEYDQMKERAKAQMAENANKSQHGCGSEMEIEDAVADKEYALKQAQMQVQLTEYDSMLMNKQVLFQKMLENNLNARMDGQMDELKAKIEALEKEKKELMEVVRLGDANSKYKVFFFLF
jgi:hypothetical protein